MSEDTFRALPHNKDAERAVLSCLIQWPDTIGQVLAAGDETLFYLPAHRAIFNAVQELRGDRRDVELIGLTDVLRASGKLEEVGGPSTLADLATDIPTPTLLQNYLHIVADNCRRRAIILSCYHVAGDAYDTRQKVEDLAQRLDTTTQQIFQTVTTRKTRRFSQAVFDAVELIERRMKSGGEIPGLSFGIEDLDEATNGMQPGQMIVVAARPSKGKTSLALNFAEHLARKDEPVLVFSAEMLAEELAIRSLSGASNIDSLRLAKGRIGKGELQTLSMAVAKTANLPIWIDDRADLRLIDIQIETRRLVKEQGIKLAVVDYLGLIREPDGSRSREDAISKLSGGLKNLAKELAIPIIVVAQLNRGPEKRADKRPIASDLRDSGSVEQDANVILLLHADTPEDGATVIDMEILVEKCRGGRLGPIPVEFHRPTTTFKARKAA